MAGLSSAAGRRLSTISLSNDTGLSISSQSALSISSASTSPTTLHSDDALTALDYTQLQAAQGLSLLRGNCVVSVPAPPTLLTSISSSDGPETSEHSEFSHVRYSALACSTTDFTRSGYTLRSELFARTRPTGILVSIILRREGIGPVLRSLEAVQSAVRALCSRRESPWGADAWKNVVLVLICDGEPQPETKALFGALGVWTDDIRASRVRGKRVTGHLFEVDEPCRAQS